MSEDRYKIENYNGHTVEFYDKYEILPNEFKGHVYLVDGFEMPSVTQVLQKQGIAEEYPDMDYVHKAAERGTLVHAECERVMLDDSYVPLSAEATWVKNTLKPILQNYKVEVLLFTEKYAGQCDIFAILSDGSYIFIDYKTGSYDPYVVAWQLTMYRYGLIHCGLVDPEKPFVFDVAELREDSNHCKLVPIQPIAYEEYKKLCDCIGTEKTYEKPFFALNVYSQSTNLTNEELEVFFSLWERLNETFKYAIAKNLANAVKKLEESIKAELIASGQNRGKTSDGCVWELAERMYTKFNEKTFAEDHPKLYAKYRESKPTKVLSFKGHPLLSKKRKGKKAKEVTCEEVCASD